MSDSSRIYSGIELNDILRPNITKNMGFQILDDQNNIQFSSTAGPPRKITWSNSRIRDIAERLNLIHVSTEFYPSSASLNLAEEFGIKVDYQSHQSWSTWFSAITFEACLMPDTNILLKRILTSVIIPSLKLNEGQRLPFKIVIPRLSILELENLANQQRRNGKPSKGECFLAFNEIRKLKKRCSMSFPLSYEKISAFNKGAGKQIVDALIREEIRSYGQLNNERVIFLTRDMISALTANAEDLDAIYIAPKNPDQKALDIGLGEIRNMIIETATDFGTIVLKWDDNTSLRIEGVWSGKNWFDYSRERVKVTSI